MKTFLATFGHLVLGVLHGFDRLVFRGHLRQLSYAHGMDCYLSANRVLRWRRYTLWTSNLNKAPGLRRRPVSGI